MLRNVSLLSGSQLPHIQRHAPPLRKPSFRNDLRASRKCLSVYVCLRMCCLLQTQSPWALTVRVAAVNWVDCSQETPARAQARVIAGPSCLLPIWLGSSLGGLSSRALKSECVLHCACSGDGELCQVRCGVYSGFEDGGAFSPESVWLLWRSELRLQSVHS